MMRDTLFVIGAGVNRCIRSERIGTPPLARDLFSSSLRSVQRVMAYTGSPYNLPGPERAYLDSWNRIWESVSFISDEFGISKDELFVKPFNIEDLFTRLELREREARDRANQELVATLIGHQQTVVSLLAIQLERFTPVAEASRPFRALARRIHNWNAGVLTFNYDTLLERALEVTSGPGRRLRKRDAVEIHDVADGRRGFADLAFTPWKWDRRLAYHLPFDLVTLPGGNIPPVIINGKQYYGAVKFLERPFLKLHGSFNWHRSLGYNFGRGIIDPMALPAGMTVLADADEWAIPITYRTTALQPIVVAPVANKDFSAWPFPEVWAHAQQLVTTASTLAIVGYSFPPTDHAARDLLSRTAVSNRLKRLIVVNPDNDVVQAAQEVCGFSGKVEHFSSVESFLANKASA
jgi:hypothetical protein